MQANQFGDNAAPDQRISWPEANAFYKRLLNNYGINVGETTCIVRFSQFAGVDVSQLPKVDERFLFGHGSVSGALGNGGNILTVPNDPARNLELELYAQFNANHFPGTSSGPVNVKQFQTWWDACPDGSPEQLMLVYNFWGPFAMTGWAKNLLTFKQGLPPAPSNDQDSITALTGLTGQSK